jgi:RNA polymerase sigma factor (sigma-70 family)
MSLEEIVKHCQLGDKDAFRELLEIIEKDALATAYLMSGTRGIAEDILQEAYIKCFNQIKKLQHPEAFKVWFYKILVRTGWELSKKYSSLVPKEITAEDEILFYNISDNVENTIETYEIKDFVQKTINKLAPKLKTVIILYYFNDMSVEEISKISGCLKATVKSRLFYARGILKKQLGEYINFDSNFGIINKEECSENG